jgi:uncharacterized membrane-anchored protein YitT (DUF2179 family)
LITGKSICFAIIQFFICAVTIKLTLQPGDVRKKGIAGRWVKNEYRKYPEVPILLYI